MNTLISIGLIGVFAYHCSINASEYKGASENLKAVMTIAGSLGFIAYVVAIIWSFWYYPWWQPVVLFLVTTIVVAPITAPLFQKHVYGYVISVMAVLAFTIIGLSSLSVANVESQSSKQRNSYERLASSRFSALLTDEADEDIFYKKRDAIYSVIGMVLLISFIAMIVIVKDKRENRKIELEANKLPCIKEFPYLRMSEDRFMLYKRMYIRIKQEKKRDSPQSYINKIIMQAPDVAEWLRFKENMDRKLMDSDNC